MNLFIVSYDLRKPGRNYEELYEYLDQLGAKQIVESTYCFKSSNSAKGLRDEFKKYIDDNDGLMVSQISDWASYNVKNSPNEL